MTGAVVRRGGTGRGFLQHSLRHRAYVRFDIGRSVYVRRPRPRRERLSSRSGMRSRNTGAGSPYVLLYMYSAVPCPVGYCRFNVLIVSISHPITCRWAVPKRRKRAQLTEKGDA